MKLSATQLRSIIAEEVSRLTESASMQTITVTPWGTKRDRPMRINVGLNYSNTAILVDFGAYKIELEPEDAKKLTDAITAASADTGGFGVQVTPGADEAPRGSSSMPGRRT